MHLSLEIYSLFHQRFLITSSLYFMYFMFLFHKSDSSLCCCFCSQNIYKILIPPHIWTTMNNRNVWLSVFLYPAGLSVQPVLLYESPALPFFLNIYTVCNDTDLCLSFTQLLLILCMSRCIQDELLQMKTSISGLLWPICTCFLLINITSLTNRRWGDYQIGKLQRSKKRGKGSKHEW